MARWHTCNVLELEADKRRVWHFDTRKGAFQLQREHAVRPGEPLPPNLVGKSWGTLFQSKLNVAWLPPEHVFLRVAQFPQSTPEETRSMVELQIERLSPIPLTQAVWTMHVLPNPSGDMQTVIVTIVERGVVEEFLGRLEGQGYLADRLESPLLDQLQATPITEDGAWVYPEAAGKKNTALVAWWYSGVLQNVDLLTLPTDADRAENLRDQLMQMAWAGEMEGWLTAEPRWHMVAEDSVAAEWVPPLEQALDQKVEVVLPAPDAEIASRTARRAAEANGAAALLPPEFATRYQRQFVDRLWGRGLLAVLGLYLAGLAIYFVAVAVLNYKTTEVETQVRQIALTYTNAIQLKSQYEVLRDREHLRFAALNAWESVAELLPENITLETMNFNGGRELRLTGTAPADQALAVIDFKDRLRKFTMGGEPLFDVTAPDQFTSRMNPGGNQLTWGFVLILKRAEAP